MARGGKAVKRQFLFFSDIRTVVYTIGENGEHALSSGQDPDFYAENRIDRYGD